MRSRLFRAFASVSAALAIAGSASAATYTWNNVVGDATDDANWTPFGTPGIGDVAVVNGGDAQLNEAATIAGFNLGGGGAGGRLSGTGTLTVTGSSIWTNGTQAGAGTTQYDGALALSGPGAKNLGTGRIVTLNGATTWSGSTAANNTITIGGSTINNNSTFTDENATNHTLAGSGINAFNNVGTYTQAGNAVTSVSATFVNSGTLNVNAGSMNMTASTHSGAINLANGASIEFRNGTNTLNNATVSGAGTLIISTDNVGADGIATINGGTLTSAFLLSGGSLRGTDQTFQGAATWTGGTITGLATESTTFGSTLTISGAGTKSLTGGRDINAGNTTWTGNTGNGNNAISIASTSAFNNTGTFTDSNTFDSAMSGGTFNNSGTFDKQSATITSIGSVFNNTGTANVNAGTMLMNGGGTDSGIFNIADGAKLEFRNGSHTLNNVTTSGDGLLEISTENVGADATVAINGGTHTTRFLMSGSTMGGTDHTFQGVATWTGGTITGAASTTFGNALTISGPNTKSLSGGRTVNAGNTTWTGNTGANNSIAISGGSVFNSSGTFTDSNAFNSNITTGGGGGTFNNIGTFNKESATTTGLSTAFNNTGIVNVNAGVFLPGGGGTSSGTFNIADGAVLEFRNGNHTLNNVTTSGAGLLQISSDGVGGDAVVTVNGGTHTTPFLLSGSTMGGTDTTFQGLTSWTGGAISGAASTTFANDVTISGAATKSMVGGRTVNLQGTTTWTGNTANNNNAIRFWNGATVNNNGTFNDDNAFNSFIEHNVGGPHNFNNIGTYNKNANTTTDVDLFVNFNNTGSVNVNAGRMHVNNATDNLGTITTAAGATFGTGGGANLQNHGILQGHGTYDPGSGRTVLNAGEVRPGTDTTVGALTVDGDYLQTAAGIFEVNLAALTNFDSMNVVNGNLALDGLLRVTSLDSYNPVLGDTFTIITFDDGVTDPADLAGTFASLTATGFHPSVLFDVLYFDHSVVLRVTASEVPAPAAAWLFGTALAGGLLRARRRRS